MARLYDRAITLLAATGALSLLGITLMIVVDVVLRNTGFRPLQSTSALSEYAMLYSTLCAAPWLVRENGHVAITAFASMMPTRLCFAVSMAVQILSVLVLAVLAWRAGAVGWDRYAAGNMDMRSVTLPGWLLYAWLSMGLALTAVEFARLALRGRVYTGSAGGA
ncbi:Tripartite ATP-independent periplasmic transporters, DctQ component [Pseudooceanicola marinus]|uniref:TRAP transporter small permease protein n=1 Tax=Pseudooceanicola marinus TaxID=396013 RepID=A0A1X6YDY8_9RHOB|nr:TRAP transporter small permease [Pseudooceanicola marinus]PJE32940.1 TRAP transporter small permease [Pseudooceanicola marinus]SLN17855.1 Tripartite ATP-independent periplasmic transporters, DctQ component [Pseudooceanicola marinus]